MPNNMLDLPEPATPLALELPGREAIHAATEIEDPLERCRVLYALSRRYRALSGDALDAAKTAANERNAAGDMTFAAIAEYIGAKSSSSITRNGRRT